MYITKVYPYVCDEHNMQSEMYLEQYNVFRDAVMHKAETLVDKPSAQAAMYAELDYFNWFYDEETNDKSVYTLVTEKWEIAVCNMFQRDLDGSLYYNSKELVAPEMSDTMNPIIRYLDIKGSNNYSNLKLLRERCVEESMEPEEFREEINEIDKSFVMIKDMISYAEILFPCFVLIFGIILTCHIVRIILYHVEIRKYSKRIRKIGIL